MRKIYLLAAMMLLAVSVNSANYISLGDDVRVHPRYLDGYYKATATMQVDGMLDDWQIIATYPDGVAVKLVAGIVPLDGMTVGYTDRAGQAQVYEAPLQVSAAYSTISSHISQQGFWDYDNDGWFESYGAAKWMPGEHQMFELNLYITPGFREGDIIFDGVLTSGADQRGPVLQGVRFYRVSHLWVGYMRGDVNGDERINITDVTVLMNALSEQGQSGSWLDEFQWKAADVNGDGIVNITDVTMLINRINAE